jgi:hypothetical protein
LNYFCQHWQVLWAVWTPLLCQQSPALEKINHYFIHPIQLTDFKITEYWLIGINLLIFAG